MHRRRQRAVKFFVFSTFFAEFRCSHSPPLESVNCYRRWQTRAATPSTGVSWNARRRLALHVTQLSATRRLYSCLDLSCSFLYQRRSSTRWRRHGLTAMLCTALWWLPLLLDSRISFRVTDSTNPTSVFVLVLKRISIKRRLMLNFKKKTAVHM